MKKIIYTLALFITVISCDSQAPKQFSEQALNDTLLNLEGDNIAFKNIISKHQGKTIVIDIWASWCGDCIKGMPKVKVLQEQFPDVAYVFLSLDRGQEAWKRGIEKYNVIGDHYYLPNAKDCDFANFVNISWIPRYMVINKAGEIVVFNVIEANDEKLIEAIKN
ncbi:TlpA disulfide reductase family protein [uncultured Algibacter sp.]|uniref:TlpA family protein disulfide reductase n=1 Tax=uncultured Algibacter sp. TaxID=298659 RepID=UPI002611B0F2|nr:TlpA disulfide reductase family protein [uncultured Algibacter sp.]